MKTKIVKRGKEYCVEFSQGVQHFRLDYHATKKECAFIKRMLDIALADYKSEIIRQHGKEQDYQLALKEIAKLHQNKIL